MMTFLRKNPVSSVTHVSVIIVYTPFSTSSHQLGMGRFSATPHGGTYTVQKVHTNECISLRELDIELMKRLSPRVNVIPVIGKADSLTPAELAESKKLVMEDIEHYRIPVYNFPYDIEEDDEDTVEENAELRGLMPFAIVGSEEVVEIGGRKVRARQYPWGVVEVDNPRHSDFLAIRSALLHSHLADLKEITHDFLYENYRTEKLSKSVEGGAGMYVIPLDCLWKADADNATSDSSMNPEDLASQSVRLKEEQLRREEEKLREIELKVQREINEKRQELLARESQLKEIEARMQREQSAHLEATNGGGTPEVEA
jgi:cell division control protein 11